MYNNIDLLLQDTFKCIWIMNDVMFHKMYSFVFVLFWYGFLEKIYKLKSVGITKEKIKTWDIGP